MLLLQSSSCTQQTHRFTVIKLHVRSVESFLYIKNKTYHSPQNNRYTSNLNLCYSDISNVTLVTTTLFRKWNSCLCTWPQVKSIKAIRVEIVAHSVTPPAFPTPRVRGISFSRGPAHTKMSWFTRNKVVHLIDHQLKVPFLILSRALAHTQKNVRTDAAQKTNILLQVY